MKTPTRIAAATAAAVLTLGVATPALAAGHERSSHPGTHSRGVADKTQALSLIKTVDQSLARISRSGMITDLSPEHQAAVLGNVSADRASLARMAKVLQRTHKPSTIQKVQRNIAKFRAQNYSDSAGLLSYSEDLSWAVGQERRNLDADTTFSPQERASLSAQIDAIEANVKSATSRLTAVNARSDAAEASAADDTLTKAEADLDRVDNTIYNN